jgi:hypothetical protein
MIIKFSRKLYGSAAVRSAIDAYKGLADFKIKDLPDSLEVEIENIDRELENSFSDEFCNFVLAKTREYAGTKQNPR